MPLSSRDLNQRIEYTTLLNNPLHSSMLREKTKRKHKVSKRIMYPCEIGNESIHVAIRRSHNRIFIKKLLWVRYFPELTFHAVPISYLDGDSQEQRKSFLNDSKMIEFDPIQITPDKRSQEYLRKHFITRPNKENWTLTQSNLKYRNWTAITQDGNDETTTDESTTTDIF